MCHKDVFFSSSEFEVAVEKKRVGEEGRRETGERERYRRNKVGSGLHGIPSSDNLFSFIFLPPDVKHR